MNQTLELKDFSSDCKIINTIFIWEKFDLYFNRGRVINLRNKALKKNFDKELVKCGFCGETIVIQICV
jgi:hypothetical protein